jgi:TadE-like protein
MARRGRRPSSARERGQVMIEFVLVAPLLFLLVGGIIQFALALNYRLDLQRIANQGARWAVVAQYPLPDGTMCTTAGCDPRLEQVLRDQAQSDGLDPAVSICFRSPDGSVGEPVRVRLETDFEFIPILGIGTIMLGADAEMRIEQPPSNVYDDSSCDQPPPPPPLQGSSG